MYKRYWLVGIDNNGFQSKMLVYGTEREMQEYMDSEIGYIPSYSGATEEEVQAAKLLRIKAYLAPDIKEN